MLRMESAQIAARFRPIRRQPVVHCDGNWSIRKRIGIDSTEEAAKRLKRKWIFETRSCCWLPNTPFIYSSIASVTKKTKPTATWTAVTTKCSGALLGGWEAPSGHRPQIFHIFKECHQRFFYCRWSTMKQLHRFSLSQFGGVCLKR